MGLGSAISSALEAARAATETLQVEVVHEAWEDQDALGEPAYRDPDKPKAFVVEGELQHVTLDGRKVTARAEILFLPEVEGEAPRDVGPRDRLTLPSGYTAPILEVRNSAVDPTTGKIYARTVWLA